MGSGQSAPVCTIDVLNVVGPSKNIKPLVLRAKDMEIVQERTEKSAEDVRHLYDSFKNQFPKEKIFKK